MKTAELLTQRLELVYGWYEGMANRDTGMLEYLYNPRPTPSSERNLPFGTLLQCGMWRCSAIF